MRSPISAEDTDRGEMGEERLQVQWNGGETMNIGFNSSYITEAMSSIDAVNVRFAFSTSTRAATIKPVPEDGKANGPDGSRPSSGQDILILVMPLRLN